MKKYIGKKIGVIKTDIEGRGVVLEKYVKRAIELYKDLGSISTVHKRMKGISYDWCMRY